MERLTERFDGGAMRKGCHGPCRTCNGAECADIYPMIDRLAACENTDLEPERVQLIANVLREVGETYNCWFSYVADCVIENSHLKDLFQAEKEGRLIVLPCKVGDAVYRVIRRKDGGGHIASATVSGLHMGDTERNHRYKKGKEYIVLKVDGNFCAHVDRGQIGKTVFLTREEAEAALKKMEEDDNETEH